MSPLLRTRRRPKPRTTCAACVFCVATAGALSGCTGGGGPVTSPAPTPTVTRPATVHTAPAPSGSSAPANGGGPATPGPGLGVVPRVVRLVEPTVVTIITKVGLGSGVIYRADGTIVTDAHVVEDQAGQPFDTVQVQFADGKRAKASVIGVDDITDVAVIKAKRTGLPAATFNDTLPVVGALDVVIGSPLGLEETVTAGIISSLHRNMPPSQEAPQGLIDLIQTDAPISPGNSGGAVSDAQGRVIGLSEAYLPPSSGAVAIGFVTPSATVTSVADQLLTTGTVKHAFLGIQPADITPQTAQQFGLPTTKGTLVVAVTPDSPAKRAGLRPGDVITRIGSSRIDDVTDLLAALRKEQPGSTVKLAYVRGAKTTTVQVTLANRPTS